MVFLTILILLSLYLPGIWNQGTKVVGLIENDCGPLNNAYVELTFNPGGEVIKTGTGVNGRFHVMGPKSESVMFRTYGRYPHQIVDVTILDQYAEFSVHYDGCN